MKGLGLIRKSVLPSFVQIHARAGLVRLVRLVWFVLDRNGHVRG